MCSSINPCDMCFKLLYIKPPLNSICFIFFYLRYKQDPWLWDLEWDVQEFKLKKVAVSKKKQLKKTAETQVVCPLPDWEEGKSSNPGL